MSAEHRGKLIIFEGIDGSGKTSQQERLGDMLEGQHYSVYITREPGGGSVEARQAFLDLNHHAPDAPLKELALILIDRTLHSLIIKERISQGDIVISDRGPASTLAYQGYARGVDLGYIRLANELATGGLRADLTVLCNLDPELAQQRLATRNGETTRFDAESLSFHRALRNGFLAEAALDPDHWVIIDASLDEVQVARLVERAVTEKLGL